MSEFLPDTMPKKTMSRKLSGKMTDDMSEGVIIDRSKKPVAVLVCGKDELGRSRKVCPWIGGPKTRNKSNHIKVVPSYLVGAYFLWRRLLMSTTFSSEIKPPII